MKNLELCIHTNSYIIITDQIIFKILNKFRNLNKRQLYFSIHEIININYINYLKNFISANNEILAFNVNFKIKEEVTNKEIYEIFVTQLSSICCGGIKCFDIVKYDYNKRHFIIELSSYLFDIRKLKYKFQMDFENHSLN